MSYFNESIKTFWHVDGLSYDGCHLVPGELTIEASDTTDCGRIFFKKEDGKETNILEFDLGDDLGSLRKLLKAMYDSNYGN